MHLIALAASDLVPLPVAGDQPDILLIAIDDLNHWIGPHGGHPQAKTRASTVWPNGE